MNFDPVEEMQISIRDLAELIINYHNNPAWSNIQKIQKIREIQKMIDDIKNVLRIFYKTHEHNPAL